MNKRVFLVLILVCVVLITGCTKKYDNGDIKEYVKELDIFKTSSNTFKVSKESFFVVDKDGYKDKVWTVNAKIDGEKIVFYVIDDHYYGSESVDNRLRSTYNYQAYLNAIDDIVIDDFVFDFSDESYLEEDNEDINFDILKELNVGIDNFVLKTNYKSLEEFDNIIEDANNIVKDTSATVWQPRICFNIYYESEYRNNVDDYPLDEADFSGCYSSSFDTNEVKKEIKDKYILMNLDYRFIDINNLFTKSEIEEVVSKYSNRLGIVDTSIDGYALFGDLIQSKHGYGVSFGTVYELLKRDYQNVVGTPVHFTYYKANGDVYEFSYSFNDMYYGNSSRNGYYYILNGEKIKMNAYFYNHLRINEVKEITGIDLVNVHYSNDKGFTVK